MMSTIYGLELKWDSELVLSNFMTCYYERHTMRHLMMTHIYCATAVNIGAHTRGKNSAEETQTVDTLNTQMYCIFILGYHDSVPTKKPNKFVTLDS